MLNLKDSAIQTAQKVTNQTAIKAQAKAWMR